MKFLSLSLSLFFFLIGLNCYSNEVIDSSEIAPWLGTWSGTLEIFNNSGKTQSVPMKIKHFRTDTIGTYGWFLIYGEEATGTRSYYLKTVDETSGHYQVDEKNSILLDVYMIGNRMISNFEVSGSLITSVYTLLDNGNMTFEILFGTNESPTISGNSEQEGEKIPKVFSYAVKGYQKAYLEKVE